MINRMVSRHGRPALRVGLSAAAGILLLFVVARGLDLEAIARSLSRAAPLPLLAALLALLADFVLRSARFWIMLRIAAPQRVPFSGMIAPFVASFGMSDLLPLRVGDGLRILWLGRRFGLPAGTVVGAMVVERVFDLASLLLVALVALFAVGGEHMGEFATGIRVSALLGVGVVVALLLAPKLLDIAGRTLLRRFSNRWIRSLADIIVVTAASIGRIGRWDRLFALFGLSLVVWGLEAGVARGAWISLGGSSGTPAPPLLAYAVAMLGTLVPSLPGHFGPFEFAGVQAFAHAGVDRSLGAAAVLLTHLLLWAPIALFTIIWLLTGGISPLASGREPEQAPLQA